MSRLGALRPDVMSGEVDVLPRQRRDVADEVVGQEAARDEYYLTILTRTTRSGRTEPKTAKAAITAAAIATQVPMVIAM